MTTSPQTSRRLAATRQPAVRVPHLAALDLTALRTYRQELITEESRVSYWRRILQARLDNYGDHGASGSQAERLRPVLRQHQEYSRRLAVLPLHDAAALPPLPDLAVLWDTEGERGGDPEFLARLTDAKSELSAYRRGLHDRLDDATSELIARYREQPALALQALPEARLGAAV